MQKFGLFSALALVASIGVLLATAPVLLHRFPLSDASLWRRIARRETSRLAAPSQRTFQFIVNRRAAVLAAWAIALVALAAGVWRVDASVQILNLLDDDADLIRDYAWIEQHIGNLVPMEVVLTMPAERLRGGDDHAEQDGQQYRLTMLERLELLRQIERRLEQFPQISRALSAATFTPESTNTGLGGVDRGGDYFKNNLLETQRRRLMAGDFLCMEREPGADRPTGRELWRLSARVSSRAAGDVQLDYAVFLNQLRRAVDPVLLAYQQRDRIVRALHEQGKQLNGARVCVLFRAPDRAKEPPADVQERTLADLLSRSGVAPRGVSYYNLATFQAPGLGSSAQDEQYRQRALASLREQDAVVLASAPSDPVAREIAAGGVRLVRVTNLPHTAESIAAPLADDGGPRPIRAVFTGMLPVVERSQRQLLATLRHGLLLAAGLAAIVITLALMSIPAAALALVSSLFPLIAVFGAMGWLGVKTDLGIMITAGVALGVAVEGTLHLATWFRRSLDLGLPRRAAAFRACQRCGPAIIDGALIGSLATAVLGLSAFVPVREFGLLMFVMLGAAMVGNLLLLPAILATPCGWFFASAAYRRQHPLWPAVTAWLASRRATPQTVSGTRAGSGGAAPGATFRRPAGAGASHAAPRQLGRAPGNGGRPALGPARQAAKPAATAHGRFRRVVNVGNARWPALALTARPPRTENLVCHWRPASVKCQTGLPGQHWRDPSGTRCNAAPDHAPHVPPQSASAAGRHARLLCVLHPRRAKSVRSLRGRGVLDHRPLGARKRARPGAVQRRDAGHGRRAQHTRRRALDVHRRRAAAGVQRGVRAGVRRRRPAATGAGRPAAAHGRRPAGTRHARRPGRHSPGRPLAGRRSANRRRA